MQVTVTASINSLADSYMRSLYPNPDDSDSIVIWSVGLLEPLDAAFCPRRFYWI